MDPLLASQTESLAAGHDEVAPGVVLLDVRRAAAYAASDRIIPGAQWRDPAAIEAWIDDVPPDRDVVVYCVHGHEVSRLAALRLCDAGRKARFLRDGIEGWIAAGRPVDSKQTG